MFLCKEAQFYPPGLGGFTAAGRVQSQAHKGLKAPVSTRPNSGPFWSGSNPCPARRSPAHEKDTSYRRLPLLGGTTVCPLWNGKLGKEKSR